MNKQRLIREQTATNLNRLVALKGMPLPQLGWVRTLRSALGITTSQLAGRLGTKKQAISRIEKDEIVGSVSIKTMRRIAEGLDCVFVYAIVPKTTLEETVRTQARKLAIKRHAQASHTMALEDQALSASENRDVLERMINDIVNDPPPGLWDAE